MLGLGTCSRRDVLRLGALSIGTAAAVESRARPVVAGEPPRAAAARACILIFLQGGPSHIDLWDPKPDAPAEVRGVFSTIETALPGVRFGELLPGTARIADRLTLVRSMTHEFNNHIAGTYIMQTGSRAQPNADREAAADDFPGPGAILNVLQTEPSRVPVSVSLPTWLSIPGPSNRMPGQYAGFLGPVYDPFLIQGDPAQADFKALDLLLPGEVGSERFDSRTELLKGLDARTRDLENRLTRTRDRLYETALDLLTDPRVRQALDLTTEPAAQRERYGRNKLGQSLLLARRLIEAGVKFVSYNEFNQTWDHHGEIERALKSRVPLMEQAFSTLVEDLADRGLLDSTLVVNTGEFGRTPLINASRGRDHWPDVYTTVLAGGGLRAGQVYGASDAKGGQVHAHPVTPADLLATLWRQLGVEPDTLLHDRLNRPIPVSPGQVVEALAG